MPITPYTLAQAIASIGIAEVFIGDPLATNGMTSLGAIEGPMTFSAPQTMNPLTAPDLTGEIPHQMQTTIGAVTIRATLIMGDNTLWPKISPIGKASGGTSSPVPVVETGCLMIPRAELGPLTGTGLFYDTTATPNWSKNGVKAAGSAPKNAIWLWRVNASFGDIQYQYANGGKVLAEVTFHAMYDAAKPEYNHVYTIGDPRAVTPTPILVLL